MDAKTLEVRDGQGGARAVLGRVALGTALALSLLGFAGSGFAQDTAIQQSPDASIANAFRKNVTVLGIPAATAAPHGAAFAVLSYTDERQGRFAQGDDTSAAVGFGLGVGGVNLQFTGNITSLRNKFGDSGFISVKASTQVDGLAAPTFVALGFDNLAPWGESEILDTAGTVTLTSFPVVNFGGTDLPMMFTLGAGSDVRDFGTEPGIFAGVGIGLTEAFGASLAFNGDDWDVGTSIRVRGLEQMNLNIRLSDAFDQNDRQRFVVSLTWIAKDVF